MNTFIAAYKSSSVSKRSRYRPAFAVPHRKKSVEFRPGERGVHTSFEIMRSAKNSFDKSIDLLDVWAVAPCC